MTPACELIITPTPGRRERWQCTCGWHRDLYPRPGDAGRALRLYIVRQYRDEHAATYAPAAAR